MSKSIIFSGSIQSSSNPRAKPKPPIHTRDTKNISLSNKLWQNSDLRIGSSHVGIKRNQMADTIAKEATKMMMTTLKLPFTDYKTKIKPYIRRKWQTIWDMSLNNKLSEHQPTIKLEIAELLPN